MVIGSLRRNRARSTQRTRLFLLIACVSIWGILVIGRLVHLQIALHDDLRARALDQQTDVIRIAAKRGDILARGGQTLATTIDLGSIYAHPYRIDDPARLAALLAPILDVSEPELERTLSNGKKFVWLRRKARPETLDAFRTLVAEYGLHRVLGFHEEAKRYYPRRTLAAHVVGHVDIDNRGIAGVERYYDEVIRGQDGSLNTLKDGWNAVVGGRSRALEEPTRGNDIVLTIDWTLQYVAERALAKAVESKGASGGSAVAMDPRTGEILAMVSYPTFNPNRFDFAMVDNATNRAVSRPFEPGSVFKVITASAAMHEGLVTEDEMIDCQGGRYRVANHVYSDWKYGFGVMPFRDVLANSSNVGTIKVCQRMAPDTYYGWIADFGFGSRTEIDLPGEVAGMLASVDRWSGLTQASMAFGQEISATPIQVATAISAIANGGLLVQPHVLREMYDREGNLVHVSEPAVRRRVLKESIARRVGLMMEHVVADGTGKPAQVPGYRVAGKTSTAQQIDPDTGRYTRFTAGFAGFLPVSDPRVVILVVVDDPQRRFGHGGSQAAAPAFQEIASAAMRVLRLARDDTPRVPTWVVDSDEPSVPVRTAGGTPNP
jgi:cell division protein FtsI (penicillin-binding protein 3)